MSVSPINSIIQSIDSSYDIFLVFIITLSVVQSTDKSYGICVALFGISDDDNVGGESHASFV